MLSLRVCDAFETTPVVEDVVSSAATRSTAFGGIERQAAAATATARSYATRRVGREKKLPLRR